MSLRAPRCHDDFVNFRIKRLLLLGGAPAVRICEGEFGVARQEWRILAALVEGGATSPTGLGRRTGMEQARASRAVSALAEKGLVSRSTDAGDRRRAVVGATEAGRHLYRRLFPRLAEVNAWLVAALTDEEASVFERCIDKLTERASALQAATDAPKADRRHGGARRVWAERGGVRG